MKINFITKHIIDDLIKQSQKRVDKKNQEIAPDLFADMFDGKLDPKAKTEFYSHNQNWTNRIILGDSLQVMGSLAEREGLRGKVQCVYFDPPYGIKFGSNWQVSTNSKEVKDSIDNIAREPEMVRAFRDTWSNGIHSYLTYIRDRLTVSYDLLKESGSIFVQISDENLHRLRLLLDEIFGPENFISIIPFRKKTMPLGTKLLEQMYDFILWYAKDKTKVKYRQLFKEYNVQGNKDYNFAEINGVDEFELNKTNIIDHSTLPKGSRVFLKKSLRASGKNDGGVFDFDFRGKIYNAGPNGFSTIYEGMQRLKKANRITIKGQLLTYKYFADDYPLTSLLAHWGDTVGAQNKTYVVQTSNKVIERCILMTTDPSDLVLDPTCGSGTSAAVSEQWGRRWITIDTSRVALALARQRLVSSTFPYYKLNDEPVYGYNTHNRKNGDIRLGFQVKEGPHITLGSIANNAEIDVIWDNYQEKLESLRQKINSALKQNWKEWQVPKKCEESWPNSIKIIHTDWWDTLIARQKEIDNSIRSKAETEFLFDQPLIDNSKVRVVGPFTVESLSPHKAIPVDADGSFIKNDKSKNDLPSIQNQNSNEIDFCNIILEHLRTTGVQQAHKENRINFTSINPYPGKFISGDGRYIKDDNKNIVQKRAAIFIGPEYGILGYTEIISAAREARDLNFDVMICCAFNYDVHASEIEKLAEIPILKARINPELHMSNELKNTGAGNLFVIFGEPDIEFIKCKDDMIQVKINGIDIFHPSKGEVISGGAESIAAWFIDTDYNEESFFVRHAYFLGASDPYKKLKSSLKAEIDKEAWESLNKDISRPFVKPNTGRIAVKVINHLGDEVMKIFNVD